MLSDKEIKLTQAFRKKILNNKFAKVFVKSSRILQYDKLKSTEYDHIKYKQKKLKSAINFNKLNKKNTNKTYWYVKKKDVKKIKKEKNPITKHLLENTYSLAFSKTWYNDYWLNFCIHYPEIYFVLKTLVDKPLITQPLLVAESRIKPFVEQTPKNVVLETTNILIINKYLKDININLETRNEIGVAHCNIMYYTILEKNFKKMYYELKKIKVNSEHIWSDNSHAMLCIKLRQRITFLFNDTKDNFMECLLSKNEKTHQILHLLQNITEIHRYWSTKIWEKCYNLEFNDFYNEIYVFIKKRFSNISTTLLEKPLDPLYYILPLEFILQFLGKFTQWDINSITIKEIVNKKYFILANILLMNSLIVYPDFVNNFKYRGSNDYLGRAFDLTGNPNEVPMQMFDPTPDQIVIKIVKNKQVYKILISRHMFFFVQQYFCFLEILELVKQKPTLKPFYDNYIITAKTLLVYLGIDNITLDSWVNYLKTDTEKEVYNKYIHLLYTSEEEFNSLKKRKF